MVISVLVGTVLGFLAGLGVGGGSLLILWLIFIEGVPQEIARNINLLFFLPAAAVSRLLQRDKGRVRTRDILPGILSGCLAAGIAAFLAQGMELALLKKLFGGLLIIIGLREVFYRPGKP
jgi:uncharacterized membrane protein YfcA